MASEERDYSHRSLIDKLGIKPQHRVCLCAIESREFAKLVASSVETAPATSARGTYDVIIYQVRKPADLSRIASLAAHLESAGGLWILHPKGKGASPSDGEVRAAGISAGLVDNKVCAYDERFSATRYVVPRALRGR